MKTKLLLIALLILAANATTYAQGLWTQKADYGGPATYEGFAFSIGEYGYMGGGRTNNQDFWEYNTATNAWTQKANFPDTLQGTGGVAFSIGTKGYLGTGWRTGAGTSKSFWEWDQAMNTWSRKADFPGLGLQYAVGFSIGAKGYIGSGAQVNNYPYNDFWEWDQLTDTWTEKADVPGAARYAAVGFSIGNKGYIGTGQCYEFCNTSQDFYEWDQNTNTWTQKASLPVGRNGAVAFSIGTKGYIAFGLTNDAAPLFDIWEWDQNTDTWVQKANYGGAYRLWATSFSSGNYGYIGTGLTSSNAELKDLWQFDPSVCYLTASYVGNDTTLLVGNSLSLVNTTNAPALFQWKVNGVVFSTATDTSFFCNNQGTFSVTLVATNGPCIDSATKVITVNCNPGATASFSASATPFLDSAVNFTNTSTAIGSYVWKVDGNTFATTANASYIFNTAGKHIVSLYISNGTCPVDSANQQISVKLQGTWVQKTSFGGLSRLVAAAFSIGTKGYIGTGEDCDGNMFNDFWEYNQATNAWTQKASFSGGARTDAVGFSIGTKGYIGTGINSIGTQLGDLYEYDPSANTWTVKASLTTGRMDAVAFSVNGYGYISTGLNGFNHLNDLWQFDPSANIWTQKLDFPGGGRNSAIGVAVNGKGYVGLGNAGSTFYTDFWEYTPSNNIWIRKADYAGSERQNAEAFTIGSKAYVGGGYDATGLKDFWTWDQNSNTWIQVPDLTYGRYDAVAFAIGSKGYIGTGTQNGEVCYNDFWEYTPGACSAYFTVNADPNQLHHYLVFNYAYGTPSLSYDWNWGDGSQDDNIAYPSHTYADSGFYNICLSITDGAGCQSTYCDNSFHAMRSFNTMVQMDVINPDIVTETSNISKAAELQFFPNPTQDNLFIVGLSGNHTLTVLNLIGETIYTETSDRKQETLSCKLFPQGIYFLQMKTENESIMKRFVKLNF